MNQKESDECVVKWFEITWPLLLVRTEAAERQTENRSADLKLVHLWKMKVRWQVLLLLITCMSELMGMSVLVAA